MWQQILQAILGSLSKGSKQASVQQPAQPSTPVAKVPDLVQPNAPIVKTSDPVPAAPVKLAVVPSSAPHERTRAGATARYGAIASDASGKLTWKDEAKWMTTYTVPADIAANWLNSASGQSAKRVYCNKDLVAPLDAALKNVRDRGLLSQLKTFDGCFQLRLVRGSTTSLSTHGYGLAIDINASTNKLGVPGDMSPELGKCFTDVGFAWGRNFHRQDAMHFSFAWE